MGRAQAVNKTLTMLNLEYNDIGIEVAAELRAQHGDRISV